jgi:hypothetical protein
VTSTYVTLLMVTTGIRRALDPASAHRMLIASSTNLYQLQHAPLRSLVASAFWISAGPVLPWALLLGATAGVLEWQIGALRAAGVFAAGHIGSSLLVAAGLTVGVLGGFVSPSVETVVDVGPSYGFAAVAAAAIALVPRRWQRVYLAGLGGWLALGWANGIDFTAVGHVLALAIGFACGPLVARWRASDAGHGLHSVPQRVGA